MVTAGNFRVPEFVSSSTPDRGGWMISPRSATTHQLSRSSRSTPGLRSVIFPPRLGEYRELPKHRIDRQTDRVCVIAAFNRPLRMRNRGHILLCSLTMNDQRSSVMNQLLRTRKAFDVLRVRRSSASLNRTLQRTVAVRTIRHTSRIGTRRAALDLLPILKSVRHEDSSQWTTG